MIADKIMLVSRRGGRGKRLRPARPVVVVLATASAVLVQMTGVPAPPAGAATAAVSYTYDAAGRLATVTTAAGTATYNYDAEGNLLSISGPAATPRHPAAPSRPATPAPSISSAWPKVVRPGQAVTIEGRGFATTVLRDVVRIGSLMARVTTASATRLTVTAPPGNGGTVVLSTPGGTAHGPRVAISQPHVTTAPVSGRDPHPLRAATGVTALSGLAEDNLGAPLPGVQISVLSLSGRSEARTVTRADGRFLLARLAPGRHQLIISGNKAGARRQYGVYAEPVELPKGQTTVLPWITYLTPLDLAHAATISSPAAHEVTVTTPRIPGLEIQVPKGTVIRDHNGKLVTKLSITPMTAGRTPYPLAPGMQPHFFTLQPGDGTVSGPGLRVTYPNVTRQPPGTAIPFLIDSPTWPGMGWWRYGTGHVSTDGKQIVPRHRRPLARNLAGRLADRAWPTQWAAARLVPGPRWRGRWRWWWWCAARRAERLQR